jgi:uncharacterized membrane protein YoaK (UPF0700 family)
VSVLCLADVKYSNGCGGLGVYVPLWEIFLLPLLVGVIALQRWRRSGSPTTLRLIQYLLVIAIVYQIGWRLDRFPVLLGLEAVAIALVAAARRLEVARRATT